ncbi:MAG: D-alanyl-D-alanine carboxypeptidase/D-alanyl-D-alanine-endopeptidase [bacterium]
MHRFIQIFLLIVVTSSIGAKAVEVETLLQRAGIKKNNTGIVVYDLNDKKTIYSLNPEKLFSIASVNKLFVTAAALKYLGQDYRFKTSVFSNLPDSSGVINGNLYIKGGGDPLFVSESMWFLVNKLVDMGVKEINGKIILDDTSFPSAEVYDDSGSDRAYSAKLSSLSVNFNAVAISATAGPSQYVAMDPDVPMLQLIDRTKKSSKKTNVEMRREGNKIIVSGPLNDSDYDNKIIYRNIDDPSSYFAQVLALHLKWRGIKNTGVAIRGQTDIKKVKLFDIESRRLNDILVEMNKFSNNYIAEQLIRAIADKKFGKASAVDKAIELVKNYMESIGLDKNGLEIVNGSGYSKMNKVKPKEMIKFLEYAYRDFGIGPEFINSLSIAGVDGTVRKTHKTEFLTGKMRAKTGTLTGVRSLAGYLNHENRTYAFIIVANDPNAYPLMNEESEILESIVKNHKGN